ncbi:hypothetical protein Bca4012_039232 [Brassica carinata]|uniref:Uncharacterized protein n=1 Tax=Brassica carinata TaxID=52824 RepID=A0A8X7W7V4_BRACI|nr:hypothetical protein Bca52824_007429 [Brassica carinata]
MSCGQQSDVLLGSGVVRDKSEWCVVLGLDDTSGVLWLCGSGRSSLARVCLGRCDQGQRLAKHVKVQYVLGGVDVLWLSEMGVVVSCGFTGHCISTK